MTDPAGTVRLVAFVIAPSIRSATVIAAVAAVCVRFVTSGTATCGLPVERTSATALPTSTSAPAIGFCEITEPAGTVRLVALVIAPTTRSAPVIAAAAAVCVRLVTSGTATCGLPVEMTSATALPTSTSAPAIGFCEITEPAGTVRLVALVIAPTTRSAPVIAAAAAVCVRLVTSGTATCGLPVETTSATALPTSTSAPATGFCEITEPAGTVRLVALVIAPSTRSAPVIAVVAAVWVRLVTSGTATCGLPVETTSATALPTSTSAAAAGFCEITEPAGTVRLVALVIAPTTRSAPVIAAAAAVCVRLVTSGTATCGLPVETTSATAVPTSTSAPAIGF